MFTSIGRKTYDAWRRRRTQTQKFAFPKVPRVSPRDVCTSAMGVWNVPAPFIFFLSHRWVTADKGTCSESASVTSLPELAGAVVICWTAGLKRTGPACCCRNKCDDHTCVLLCNKSFDVNKNAFVIHPFVVLLWGLTFGNASWCLFFLIA